MQLTEKETQSELWQKLLGHFDDLVKQAHRELEKTTLTADQTALMRGRLKLLRELQRLNKPAAEQTVEYR